MQYNVDFYMAIGLGLVPGFDYVHKYGRNPEINTADGFESIWQGGGEYTGFNPEVAGQLEVFSGSTLDKGALLSSGTVDVESKIKLIDEDATFISDGVSVGDAILNDTDKCHGIVTSVDSEIQVSVLRFDKFEGRKQSEVRVGDNYRIATAASTGAAVCHLQHLLDQNLANETDEFVILDGTTSVSTVGEYRRNSRGSIILAGLGGVNAATVTSVDPLTSTNIMMQMPAGYNKSMICAYTVPSDVKSAHLTGWFASLAGKTQASCNVRLVVRHTGEVDNIFEEFAIQAAGSSYLPREYKVPKNGISPGSDIHVDADTDTNSASIAASFDLILKL